jgi:hypothetical protein
MWVSFSDLLSGRAGMSYGKIRSFAPDPKRSRELVVESPALTCL